VQVALDGETERAAQLTQFAHADEAVNTPSVRSKAEKVAENRGWPTGIIPVPALPQVFIYRSMRGFAHALHILVCGPIIECHGKSERTNAAEHSLTPRPALNFLKRREDHGQCAQSERRI